MSHFTNRRDRSNNTRVRVDGAGSIATIVCGNQHLGTNNTNIMAEVHCAGKPSDPSDKSVALYWITFKGFSPNKAKKIIREAPKDRERIGTVTEHDRTFDLTLRSFAATDAANIKELLESRTVTLKPHGFQLPEDVVNQIAATISTHAGIATPSAAASNGHSSPLAEALARPVAGVTSSQQQR